MNAATSCKQWSHTWQKCQVFILDVWTSRTQSRVKFLLVSLEGSLLPTLVWLVFQSKWVNLLQSSWTTLEIALLLQKSQSSGCIKTQNSSYLMQLLMDLLELWCNLKRWAISSYQASSCLAVKRMNSCRHCTTQLVHNRLLTSIFGAA